MNKLWKCFFNFSLKIQIFLLFYFKRKFCFLTFKFYLLFFVLWIRINFNTDSEPNKYSGYVYDAVWLYAIALGTHRQHKMTHKMTQKCWDGNINQFYFLPSNYNYIRLKIRKIFLFFSWYLRIGLGGGGHHS